MATVSNVTTTTTTTIPPANAPGNKGKNKNKGKKRNFKDLATEESNDSITMTDVNDAAAPNSKKAKIENSMDIVPIEGVDDVKVETNGHNNNNNNDTNDPAAWSNLQVSEPTQRAIKDLGFEKMTEIQYKAIPEVMAGHDLAGGAKTGSGKTLAFVIPAVEMLVKNNWTLQKGTGAIIVAPTRELALQIKGVAQQIVKYHKGIRVGLVIGGGSKMAETHALRTGCPVLVATPGRLFDHLSTTRFTFSNLKMLVIDEADHILDIGFEQQMNDILDLLPTERQTLLFSATLNNKIKDLVSKAFRNRPVFVKAQGEQKGPTADKLVQMYSIIPQDKKLVSLLSWLKHHQNEKILVFFSTRKGTKFYEDLFHALGINVLALYGAMSQDVRTRTFFKFVEAKSGILLATNVASRGLDFPAVHWIIQYDPPEEPKEYIHRVGRTARAGLKGEAMTFLRESELSYLDILRACDLELQEIKINIDDADEIQKKVEETVSSRYVLQKDAVEAFKSFIRGYQQRAVAIFGNDGVNSDEAAKSFGLSETPKYQSRGFRGRGRSKDGGNFRGGSGQSRGFGRGGFGRGGRGESRGGRGGFGRESRGGGFGRGRGRGEFGRGRGRGESRGRGNGSRGGFME